jgi:hypothetical protein
MVSTYHPAYEKTIGVEEGLTADLVSYCNDSTFNPN